MEEFFQIVLKRGASQQQLVSYAVVAQDTEKLKRKIIFVNKIYNDVEHKPCVNNILGLVLKNLTLKN